MGKGNTLFRKPKMPYLLQLKSERGKTNFVGKRTTKATFARGKLAMEILQRDGRYKSSAWMNRQNRQAKRGDLSSKLELPSNFPDVHDVFHVS